MIDAVKTKTSPESDKSHKDSENIPFRKILPTKDFRLSLQPLYYLFGVKKDRSPIEFPRLQETSPVCAPPYPLIGGAFFMDQILCHSSFHGF